MRLMNNHQIIYFQFRRIRVLGTGTFFQKFERVLKKIYFQEINGKDTKKVTTALLSIFKYMKLLF